MRDPLDHQRGIVLDTMLGNLQHTTRRLTALLSRWRPRLHITVHLGAVQVAEMGRGRSETPPAGRARLAAVRPRGYDACGDHVYGPPMPWLDGHR